jgi:putative ABC transport system permease protein
MDWREILKLAFSSIWAHKLRSALTLLGMIIGVTAVVVVVSMIQGFNTYVDEKIAGIGTQSFSVRRFNLDDFKDTDTIARAQRRNPDLKISDFEYLRDHATLIDKIGAKALSERVDVKRETEILNEVPVHGATSNIAEIEQFEVEEGRFFSEAENSAALNVAYLGYDVAVSLFPYGSALDKEINIRGVRYKVIGVNEQKGTVFGVPQDTFIYIPLRSYIKQFGPPIRWRSLYFVVTARSEELFNDAVEEVRQLMRVKRKLGPGDKDNFGVMTPDAITGLRDRIFGQIFIVAIAVPSIALVVGGIVIMNIMLVSVTERTKEIGIRKAIGAPRRDIMKQFLAEAVVLSAIGGAAGVLIAWAIGFLISTFVFPTYLSILAIVVAVTVSGAVGILSGIFPAWKAASLDPIEALRAE